MKINSKSLNIDELGFIERAVRTYIITLMDEQINRLPTEREIALLQNAIRKIVTYDVTHNVTCDFTYPIIRYVPE